LQGLGDLPDEVQILTQLDGVYDFVQLFIKDRAELERLGPMALAILNVSKSTNKDDKVSHLRSS
jgi:hypothetical protein